MALPPALPLCPRLPVRVIPSLACSPAPIIVSGPIPAEFTENALPCQPLPSMVTSFSMESSTVIMVTPVVAAPAGVMATGCSPSFTCTPSALSATLTAAAGTPFNVSVSYSRGVVVSLSLTTAFKFEAGAGESPPLLPPLLPLSLLPPLLPLSSLPLSGTEMVGSHGCTLPVLETRPITVVVTCPWLVTL